MKKNKETVVNSELIKWQAVDRVAVRVITPALWYNKPPIVKQNAVPVKETSAQSDNVRRCLSRWQENEDSYEQIIAKYEGSPD